jgi:hypothetical protein
VKSDEIPGSLAAALVNGPGSLVGVLPWFSPTDASFINVAERDEGLLEFELELEEYAV